MFAKQFLYSFIVCKKNLIPYSKMKYKILISIFLFLFVRLNAEEIVFTKQESPYLITEDLVINSSDTLLILHGATLIIDQDINIIINGTLLVNGSKEEPVSFLPQVQEIGWGKIELNKLK